MDVERKVKYQVFVSSTYKDLVDERKEVSQGVLEAHCIPVGMELFPASSKQQWEFIKKVIDESDIYLVVIAGRYGSEGTDDDGNKISYTEMEFDYAVKTGKPIISLLHENPDQLPKNKCEKTLSMARKLEKFRSKAMKGRLIRTWNNCDNLKAAVMMALTNTKEELKNEMLGWVRGRETANEVKKKLERMECEIQQLESSNKFLQNKIVMKGRELGQLRKENESEKIKKEQTIEQLNDYLRARDEEISDLRKLIHDASVDRSVLDNNAIVNEIDEWFEMYAATLANHGRD